MRKIILQSLAVLGLNLFVGLLASGAFLIYLSKGDLILAAVPGVLALPALLLQPWFVAFVFLPGGFFIAPFLTTAVTVPLYRALDHHGKLEGAKRTLARIDRGKAVVMGFALLFLLSGVGLARYRDFPPLRTDAPPTMLPVLEDLDLEIGESTSYCVSSFIDSQWLWQATLDEAELDRLAVALGLEPLAEDQIGEEFVTMPPYWWRPRLSEEARVLATRDFSMTDRGPDGRHAFAIWNPDDQVLHMWIKDNF